MDNIEKNNNNLSNKKQKNDTKNEKKFKKFVYKPIQNLSTLNFMRPKDWTKPLDDVTLKTEIIEPKEVLLPIQDSYLKNINLKNKEIEGVYRLIDNLNEKKEQLKQADIEEYKRKNNQNKSNFEDIKATNNKIKNLENMRNKVREIKDEYNRKVDIVQNELESIKKSNYKKILWSKKAKGLEEELKKKIDFISNNKFMANEENVHLKEIKLIKDTLKNLDTEIKLFNEKDKLIEKKKKLVINFFKNQKPEDIILDSNKKQIMDEKQLGLNLKELFDQRKLIREKINHINGLEKDNKEKNNKDKENRPKRELTKGEKECLEQRDKLFDKIKSIREDIKTEYNRWDDANHVYDTYLMNLKLNELIQKKKNYLDREANKAKYEEERIEKLKEILIKRKNGMAYEIKNIGVDYEECLSYLNSLRLEYKNFENLNSANNTKINDNVNQIIENKDDNLILIPKKEKLLRGKKIKPKKQEVIRAEDPFKSLATDFELIKIFSKINLNIPKNMEDIENLESKVKSLKLEKTEILEEKLKEYEVKLESGELLEELKKKEKERYEERRNKNYNRNDNDDNNNNQNDNKNYKNNNKNYKNRNNYKNQDKNNNNYIKKENIQYVKK